MPTTQFKVLNCLHRAHFGGAQWRVVWIGEALQQQGIHTVVLFPATHDMEYEQFLRKRKFPYARLKMPVIRSLARVSDNILFLLDLPFQINRILKFIRANCFNLIHVNGMTNLGPLIAAVLAGKPIIWHWNDTQTPKWFSRLLTPLIRRSWLVVASQAVWTKYGRIVYVDSFLGVIPPPLPNEEVPYQSLDVEFCVQRPIVGFVGSIVESKGVIEYVQVISQLRSQGIAATGVMVGSVLSGHEAFGEKLNKVIGDLGLRTQIMQIGYRYDVNNIMRNFDVLLFPSHTEAAPIVIIQAMALGIPIVATKVGNIADLLSDTGMEVVAVGDVPAMVKATRVMLALDKVARDNYSKKSKRVSEQYSIHSIANKHAIVYRKVLDQHARI